MAWKIFFNHFNCEQSAKGMRRGEYSLYVKLHWWKLAYWLDRQLKKTGAYVVPPFIVFAFVSVSFVLSP